MLIASLITFIVGLIVFLFVFWKRLREDYSSEIIFRSAFNILLGIGLGYLISVIFFHQLFLWASFFGGIFGLFASIYFLKIKFYESFEAFVISSLPWISFTFLADSVVNSSLISFLGFLTMLILTFISYWLDNNYKKISWYKSGRVGISGLITLSLIFIIRIVLASFKLSVLSFLGVYELILSGLGILVCSIFIYNLNNDKK